MPFDPEMEGAMATQYMSAEADWVGKAVGDGRPRTPRWLRVILPVLLALGLSFALWQARVGQAVIGDVHHRNFHALDVAANGLQYWPGALRGLAIANFTQEPEAPALNAGAAAAPQRQDRSLQGSRRTADARRIAEGWQYEAVLFHPRFGRFEILYKIAPPGGCDALSRQVAAAERARLPFISSFRAGEGPQLKILDFVPLREIWLRDHVPQAPVNGRITLPDGTSYPADRELCYGATVSLDKLLAVTEIAPQFTNVLVIDNDRKVRQQLGARSIPVDSLDRLVPADSPLRAALMSASGIKADHEPAPKERQLANALEPERIDVGGVAYEAYVNPFQVKGCEAAAEPGPAPNVQTKAPATCFLVGLMPRSQLWHSALKPTPLFLTALGFTVLIALALLLPVRLLLIGPGDAVSRYAARAAVLSVLAFASLAALLILFLADVGRERKAMAQAATTTAATMAASAQDAIRSIVIGTVDHRTLDLAPDLFGTPTAQRKGAPEVAQRVHATGRLALQPPPLESIAAVNSLGTPLACGAWQLKFRQGASSRFNVSGRDYFQRFMAGRYDGVLRAGDPRLPGTPYTIDQVRDQTDGIVKTIVLQPPPPGYQADSFAEQTSPATGGSAGRSAAAPPGEDPCVTVALLTSAVLPTFYAPVLPYRLGYAVIDTRDPDLPVLFHQDAEKAGAEEMARDLDRSALRHLQQWIAVGMPGSYTVAGKYDGKDRTFALRQIAGTSWAVMVFFSPDDVDETATNTVARALAAGIALSVVFLLGWGVFTFFYPDVVANVWPHERGRPRFFNQGYGRSSLILLVLVGLDLLVLLFGGTNAAMLMAGFVVIACVSLLHLNNWRKGETTHPLTPRTERRYFLLMLILVAGMSVLPTVAIWRDASAATRLGAADAAASSFVGSGGAFKRQQFAIPDLTKVWCGADPLCRTDLAPFRRQGVFLADAQPAGVRAADPFLDWFWRRVDDEPKAAAWPGCASVDGGAGRPCPTNPATARSAVPGRVFTLYAPSPGSGGWVIVTGSMVLALAAVLALVLLVRGMLIALPGFSVPLGPVTSPHLIAAEGDAGVGALSRRTLLVGAPRSLRRALGEMDNVAVIDLAGPDWLTSGAAVYLVTNLHLLLRDPERRRVALTRLEQLNLQLGRRPASLIVLSNQVPLERILEAYERDRRHPEERSALSRNREQLRWATLFEKFATVAFPPSQKIDFEEVEALCARTAFGMGLYRPGDGWLKQRARSIVSWFSPEPHSRNCLDRIASVRTIMNELAWLPEDIIAALIGVSPDVPASGTFPPSDRHLQAHFTQAAFEWAWQLRIVSPPAAVDFLRGMLIEHYQKCWSASTYAERVVLDHIAHRRLVNIRSARIPLASLVRRGLVVFSPEPRLMNRSFAVFARQAERPDRLRGWQRERRGAWSKARWPVLVGMPILIVAMAVAWMLSDADVASWAPLLAAGAPALAAALFRTLRRQLPPLEGA